MSDEYDVLIAGAGPAGTSAAIRLALAGRRVLLAEAKSFPRHKLCGEFISPECLTHFARLGVRASMMNAGGAAISETVFYAPSGKCTNVPSNWFEVGGERHALGLSRAEMDAQLLNRARAVGVDVRESARAVGVVQDETGAVRGVRLKTDNAKLEECRARITIDATGRSRALAHRIKNVTTDAQSTNAGTLTKPRTRAALVAFKAHIEGARGIDVGDDLGIGGAVRSEALTADANQDRTPSSGRCEIYFYPGGYGGLNGVEGGQANLCFIVRAEDVRVRDGDPARVLCEVVCANKRAAWTLGQARVVTDWLCVALESFGRCELVPADGILTIGDAASFIDPFTGSGMLMALQSGELAAETVNDWLAYEPDDRASTDAFAMLARSYRTGYAARFERRLRICSWLRRAAFAPGFAVERTIAGLGLSRHLRRTLAQATRRPADEEKRCRTSTAIAKT